MALKSCPEIEAAEEHRRGRVSAKLIGPGVVYLRFDGPEVDTDDVEASIFLSQKLVVDGPWFCLTDLREVSSTTSRARQTRTDPNVVRLALVYSSPVGRMLGNAYLRLRRAECPVKLFAEPAEALAWLEKGRN